MALAELMGATGLSEPLRTDELLHYEIDAGNGLRVKVASDPLNTWGTYAIGHTLWSAAPELINCLVQTLPPGALHGQRVIELGAGLGAVGNALALHGASVTLTDLPVCLELLRYNVALNFAGKTEGAGPHVAVQELVWGEAQLPAWCQCGGYDWVLASDVCYDGERFQPLLDTLLQLAILNPETKVVLSLPDRTETHDFFPLVVASGFTWRVLRRVRREDLVHAIHVYQLVLQPGSIARQLPQKERVLAVWDFDWTMVEDNSDTWVVERLGAKPDFQRLQEEVVGWTELMDASMAAAASAHGADEAAVRTAARSVPVTPDILQAVKGAAQAGVRQVIVSDANNVFIEELLMAHSLQGCITTVHTNPAAFENGVLRVRPHAAEPHLCDSVCPDNMCKGKTLERILLAEQPTKVVYLGDGRGDFCACTRLGPSDAILARTAYPDGRPAALLQLLAAESASIKAANGAALTAATITAASLLPPPPQLPPDTRQHASDDSVSASADTVRAALNGSNGGDGTSTAKTAGVVVQTGCSSSVQQQSSPGAAEQILTDEQTAATQSVLQHDATWDAVQHHENQLPADAVAQRRDHQNPEAVHQNDIPELQEAAAAKGFMWPAGDVAATVHAWATPQECALLYRQTLRSWGVHC